MKTFVLDTNILLHDPMSLFNFGENEIVIPAIVLEELDSKKREQNEIGRNARMITRMIKELRKGNEGMLNKGIALENGGILRVELNHISFDKLQDIFGERTNDNRIIAVAKNLQDEFEEYLDSTTKIKLNELKKQLEDKENKEYTAEVYWAEYYELTNRAFILVSNDGLVIAKADALGLQVEMYENDRIKNIDAVHKGHHVIYVPSELINRFYELNKDDDSPGMLFDEVKPYLVDEDGDEIKNVYPQDFFTLKELSGSKQSALARLLKVGNQLKLVTLVTDDGESVWGITPRNAKQRMLVELLLDPNVPLVCVAGQAGTGKTLLALAAALYQTEDLGLYKKTLVARPVIPMGKDIGYLPGDMNEKLRPWMQPIYDNLEFLLNIDEDANDKNGGGYKVEDAVQDLKLEIEALTYIRGRSIPQQFLIFDEFQNSTPHEALTILTRVGEGTKIILLGDPNQIDHPYLDGTNNGLTYVMDRMKQESDVGILHLDKTERSNLAEKEVGS